MSKTSKILAVCLVVFAIALVVQVISSMLSPDPVNYIAPGSTLCVITVLIIALSKQKAEDKKKQNKDK